MSVQQQKSQQDYLQEAKEAVNQGHSNYARRVMFAWFTRMGISPPFQVNQTPGSQTVWCADCSTGVEPVKAEFHWDLFGSLCSTCSLIRFSEDGSNPRVGDEAERRGRR